MKKMIITVMAALFMFACGEKKTIDPAQVEAMKAIVSGAPAKTEAHSPAVNNVAKPDFTQSVNIRPSSNYDSLNMLLVEPDSQTMERLQYMTSGDIYFTIVLDDNSHYICTSIDDVTRLMAMLNYFIRSGDMIDRTNVEEYLHDYVFDGYLNGDWSSRMTDMINGTGMAAYTENPWDNKFKNWVNGK